MKKFITENKSIVVILLAGLITGGFIYASQLSKQKSIEKQQENTLIQAQEERCQKLAVQRKKDEDTYFRSFEYHYNPNTKMCVLAYLESNLGNIFGLRYIVTDLFTDKEIYNEYPNPGNKEKDLDKEWRHIADLYFYQKEVRVP